MTATPQMLHGRTIPNGSIGWALDGADEEKAITAIQTAFAAARELGFTNVAINYEPSSTDYYCGAGQSSNMGLKGDRMETQEEADARVSRAAQLQAFVEKREREQFEALKAKFG